MRSRLLVLLACAGAALTTLAAAGPAQAKPAFDTDWSICAGPTDTWCIESAKANGVDTVPGQGATERDYPWVKQIDDNLIDFGVWHDLGTGSSTNEVDPAVTYRLVVRTGTFVPREMNAVARNGSYSVGRDSTGWKFTVQFQPTAVHHTSASCTVDAGCGGDTTAADDDLTGYATGDVQTLATSGLPAAEIGQRTGMATFTNAQDDYLFYNADLGVLEVRLANPHLWADGTTKVTDGTYDAFVPNAFLVGTVGVPDPALLPGFTVTKTVGATTTAASATMTHVPGGIRLKISGISFSRPVYRLTPRPTPPGRPRAVRATKPTAHSAKVRFARPLADGRARIDFFQARCHRLGKPWHYARRTTTPITVKSLPKGKVWCQARAHNRKGYGAFSAPVRTR